MGNDMKDILCNAGINYEALLNRFCANEQLLEKFIKRFPQDTTFQMLKKAVAARNVKDVEIAAHTLKGVSANLGFEKLSELCAEIVALVRQDKVEDAAGRFGAVEAEYKRLLLLIEKLD